MNVEEIAKQIYSRLSPPLSFHWSILDPYYQRMYIDLAQEIHKAILQHYSNTLFIANEKGEINFILDKQQVDTLYKKLNCWDSEKAETIITAVDLLNRSRQYGHDFYGYKSILENLSTSDHKYCHAQVRSYARSMLSLLNNSPALGYFDAEIKSMLQTMTLYGLPHYDRAFLAKEILSLLKQGEELKKAERERKSSSDEWW